ncbi:MAG TPA: phosphodiester glycosidase family protein, partial [Polyangiaceae bacterium]
LGAAWLAVRQVPWFGPLLADSLRSLVGSERVTQLEETVAGVEDHVQQVVSDGRARSLTEATPSELLVTVAKAETTGGVTVPSAVGAMYPATASVEDGSWQAVSARAGEPGSIYRTIVHPDSERVYAELFVFALDLSKLSVHAVAGSVEPKSVEPAPGAARPGIIPESDRGQLVAAFNGGFKAEHGQFGMMVDGTELLAPKPQSCTFAATSDGSLRIAPWANLSSPEGFSWWRQTPGCMLVDGVLHPGLRTADSRNWGATLEGKTVIRRSAVGLSADARTLFVGISNATTARALALGMQHVGARDVAQLDVNFSFPRFLLYREGEGSTLNAVGAVRGLLYQPDEYLGHASTRDFFYVTARP